MSPITSPITMRPAAVRFLLGLLAAAVFSGAAIAQNRSDPAPADLHYRLDLLDAELQDIRSRVGDAPSAGSWSGIAGSGRLEDEFARLTGQIEQLQFELRKLREAVRRRLEDLTFRVVELEGGDVGRLGPITLDETPPGAAGTVILSERLSEREDIDRAKLDIRQGRFVRGEELLNRFIASHPSSSLIGEAHYWLGQSRFARGAFPDAARSYLAGYERSPRDGFAPNNLLNLGIALGRLDQILEACRTLDEVGRQYPDASDSIRQSAIDEKVVLACP